MAARGARAAARADAAHRRAHDRGRRRSGMTGPPDGASCRTAGLGWTDGRNVRIDVRWAAGLKRRTSTRTELVALAPDVRLAARSVRGGIATVDPHCADRVCEGGRSGRRRLRRSLARPGGNVTGFTHFEFGLSGKWLELLKEIAPRCGARGSSGTPAPRHRPVGGDRVRGVVVRGRVSPVDVRDAGEIERAV